MTLARVEAGALSYQAPFLIEKLLKDRIVESSEEGEALFAEVKRYIVLVQLDRTKIWEMYSLRVDEVWHQFILFTTAYMDFCELFFGGYVHHSPSNAPESKTMRSAEVASFEVFAGRYHELFGQPLSDAWYDEKAVTPGRRVFNDHAGMLVLRHENEEVDLLNAAGDVLMTVNELAKHALAFISGAGAFYVRELPGDLTDAEKVELVATLVEYNILRVAG